MNTRNQIQETTTSRSVLLFVSGLSPQIITETIYARLSSLGAAGMPEKVFVITTLRGAELIFDSLIDPAGPRHLHQLLSDFGLPTEHELIGQDSIQVIKSDDGSPLEDIKSPSDNEAAADSIVKLVRILTAGGEPPLHASIAGGRKTMGFYLGHAMSMYARPQDEISHVLVSSPFEGHPDFFYPPARPRNLRISRNGKRHTVNTSQAEIRLAPVPIIRLRSSLPSQLLDEDTCYGQAVAMAQRSLSRPHLVIDVDNGKISCSGQVITLPNAQLGLLAWMADRARRGLGGVKRMDMESHAEEFIEWRGKVAGAHSGSVEALESSTFDAAAFDSTNSRLRRLLERQLGTELASAFRIELEGGKRNRPMVLNLASEQIEFRCLEDQEAKPT